MSSPRRWGRLAYHFDRRIQVTAYLTLASSVPRHARIEAQKGHVTMRWLDDLGAVLGLTPVYENNRPPLDMDLLLRI
eukprot:10791563-Alexandrium_andersonii.AAC.1